MLYKMSWMSPRHATALRFLMSVTALVVVLRVLDYPLTTHDPLLQPVWDWMLMHWPHTVSQAGFAGLVGIVSFAISCVCFSLLDITRSPTKIQKDVWPTLQDMLWTGGPQMAIYLSGNSFGWYMDQHIVLPSRAPTLPTLAREMLLAFVIGDFLIYLEHRMMHAVPFLRKHIHSWHHAYTAPFSWAGGVVHPLEDAVVILTQVVGPLACGFHPLSFWLFVAVWVALLIEEHSGHDVWWAPYNWMPFTIPVGGGAAPHDIHHYKAHKNFGFVLVVWDLLFDTYEPVVVPPHSPGRLRKIQ
eukprot:gnl/TRDRNA2_/TRDRNA2_141259_c0_seq1.p1 gnl/TRDRNA2_/TRDRNA2_141259_c0~~gnl/TRDRNA2_/TRDRNA2_141259_c0_seq1.p1  ORF type:complete len:299 (-),score=16.39 gnl/TRDRNA2_/TRDRNA2_141259_c0_seq1:55-951(-)